MVLYFFFALTELEKIYFLFKTYDLRNKGFKLQKF